MQREGERKRRGRGKRKEGDSRRIDRQLLFYFTFIGVRLSVRKGIEEGKEKRRGGRGKREGSITD